MNKIDFTDFGFDSKYGHQEIPSEPRISASFDWLDCVDGEGHYDPETTSAFHSDLSEPCNLNAIDVPDIIWSIGSTNPDEFHVSDEINADDGVETLVAITLDETS